MKLSLVAALLAATACAAAPVRGVPRSQEAAYANQGGKFTCLDKSRVIDAAQVNDDYCDCADGSDEPGTSACANGRFYCPNKGYRGKFVPSVLVNDGICDCCDGSDEFSSKAGCKNTCEVDGATWRTERTEAIRKAEEGAKARQLYAEAGKAAAEERSAKIATISASLEKARAEREAKEKDVVAHEESERVVTEQRKGEATPTPYLSPDERVASNLRIDGYTREALVTLLIEHTRRTGTGKDLVALLRERAAAAASLGPVGGSDDTSVPETEGGEKTYGIEWTDGAAASGSSESAHDYRSPEGDAARSALEAAREAERKLDEELKAANEEEGSDFGPDSAFHKLKGACVELKVNQYTYSVCPFGAAKQDYTTLGSFSGWGKKADGSTPDYSKMLFTGGSRCWNGPDRSMTVTFECGATDALLTVDEPEKCAYASRVTTPAACEARHAEALRLELEGGDEEDAHDHRAKGGEL